MKEWYKIGWFTDQKRQVIPVSEDRIVLEITIRDSTHRELDLPEDFVGIRTVWILFTDSTDTDKWGVDLTKGIPSWSWDWDLVPEPVS